MSTTRDDSNQGSLAGEQGVQPVSATFRRILHVVFLIFLFAVVQMLILWRVCDTGMKTAAMLEHQGLPTLNQLASLQEHLAICRLNSYEYLFAREEQKAATAKTVETVSAQAHSELNNIKALLPEGEGRRLASNLEAAMIDLDAEFRVVRELVDSDFAAGMEAMDQEIPPRTDRVTAAAGALKDYVYHFSGGQANATFGSFGWIKSNAIIFGAGNILVVFGAVMFIRLAARRSRAQLSDTLSRLDQRTQELAGSLSIVHATLEATADGILLVDTAGQIRNFNQQFVNMWRVSDPVEIMTDRRRLLAFVRPLVERSEKFAGRTEELIAHPDQESLDTLELKDGRVFECRSKPQRIQDRICGRVWSTRDITERKRAEEKLQQSEGRIRAITDSAQDAILMMDPEGRITFWNPAAERILGYTSAEAIGQDLHDLIVPARFHPAHNAAYPAFLETGRGAAVGKVLDIEACRKDGLEISVQLSISAVQMSDGWHAVGIVRDATERKKAEMEIQHQAAFARFNPNPVLELSAAGEITFFNHAAEAMARDLGLDNPAQMLPPNTAAMVPECLAAARSKLRVETPIGERVLSWSFFPIKFTNTVHGYAGDITERKRAEETLAAEQRLLNNLITATPDIVYFKDRESRFIRINEGFARRNGLGDPSAAVGKTDFDIFGRHASQAFADEQRIIATGQPMIDKEEREDWKDGRVTWVSSTKMPLLDGAGKTIGIMGISRDITERRRAEESLRLLGSAVEQAEESIYITDTQLDLPGPKLLFVNPAFTKITGYTAEEVLGKTPRLLQGAHTDPIVLAGLRAALARGEAFHGEVINYRKDASEFHAELHIAPIRDPNGILTHFVAIMRDITERRLFEERLYQSQKLETVGKLAGGIAHEFNSIMTAIIGQSELMLYDLPQGNPLRNNVSEIHQAAERAATLTRQLLAYGRKQILQPDVLDLNTVLAGMENTLRHLAGRDVDVLIAPPAGPKLVKADPGQIEQVIVNIVMNAADAMPHGGKLTLETAETFLDEEYVSRFPDLKAGEYVMLAITDTGAGMSDAVKARLFEPFFTSKDVGKGTGLGLATCHGIIKQSGGHINVYSEPGRGATFKIYLPKAQLETKPLGPPLQSPGLPRGTETILLVEDDPALREMAAALLGRLGYTVFPAGNGLEALNRTHQAATGHIDLLFTDVVMPHMSGKELADRIQALYPRTKILFTSAYTENAIVHQGVLNPGIAILQKPFTPSALANKVREILDNPR